MARAAAPPLGPHRGAALGGRAKAARSLNSAGLRTRKRGDHEGALMAYAAAVSLDPHYGWARFNLACELALSGRADDAMEELQELARHAREGDLDAARALGHAATDPDLRALRGRGALKSLVASFSFRPGRPLMRQLCGGRDRLLSLVDGGRGLVRLAREDEMPEDYDPAGEPPSPFRRARGRKAYALAQSTLTFMCRGTAYAGRDDRPCPTGSCCFVSGGKKGLASALCLTHDREGRPWLAVAADVFRLRSPRGRAPEVIQEALEFAERLDRGRGP